MLPPPDVIAGWRREPRRFVNEAFRDPKTKGPVRLAEWQERALDLVRDHDRVSIRAGRGVGKTAFLVLVSFWRLLCFKPAKNIFTAPRKAQMDLAAWPEMRFWLAAMDPDLASMFKVQADKVVVKYNEQNFSAATTVNVGSYEGLQGVHDPSLLWIVDEANGVADSVFDVAMGSLTTAGSKVLLCGNPRQGAGFFFKTQMARGLADIWQRLAVSVFDVRGMSYFNAQWIEERRADWGENSWQWYSYVLGEFPREQENAAIPLGLIMEAAERKVEVKPGYHRIWGFDPAAGGDRCSLVKRHANVVEEISWWREKDTTISNDKIVEQYYAAENKPAWIVVDATGFGIPIANELQRTHKLPIIKIGASERPLDGDLCLNSRAEMWLRGRDWFAGRDVAIPYEEDLIEELAAPAVDYTSDRSESGGRKTRIEGKKEIKERIGRSTDLADAFLLTLMAKSREHDHDYIKRQLASKRRGPAARNSRNEGTTWLSRVHF